MIEIPLWIVLICAAVGYLEWIDQAVGDWRDKRRLARWKREREPDPEWDRRWAEMDEEANR
jgi:hypothetical protein